MILIPDRDSTVNVNSLSMFIVKCICEANLIANNSIASFLSSQVFSFSCNFECVYSYCLYNKK